MQEWLISFSGQHALLTYLVIFALTYIGGPTLSVLLGVLLRMGYFNFFTIYTVLMAADLVGDAAWYYVGSRFGHAFVRRYGKIFRISETDVAKTLRLFHRHKYRIIFFAKLTNALGLAILILITAGMARIPFGSFILLNALGQLFWTGLLLGVGYFCGNLYLHIASAYGHFIFAALVLLALVILMKYKNLLREKFNTADPQDS